MIQDHAKLRFIFQFIQDPKNIFYLRPNSMFGNCCTVCCNSLNLWRVSSNTLYSLPVRKLKILTFLSPLSDANRLPSGDIANPHGKVLFLANSNKSVSNFDSKDMHLGNLYSNFGPVQYSNIPALSTEMHVSYTVLYCVKKEHSNQGFFHKINDTSSIFHCSLTCFHNDDRFSV